MADRVPTNRSLTPDEEAVLTDELLRERIRRINGEPRPVSRWEKLTRHPLAAVTLGFCLTGVVGTYLTHSASSAREDRERRLEDYRSGLEEEREGLERFASRLFERHTLGTRLWTALNRGASRAEIDARRADYELSVARWGTALPSSLFLIRHILRAERYTPVETLVEGRLENRFQEADDSLLAAYDRAVAGRPIGDLTRAREALDQALTCGAQVAETLHQVVEHRGPPTDDPGLAARAAAGFQGAVGDPSDAPLPMQSTRPAYLEALEEMCPK